MSDPEIQHLESQFPPVSGKAFAAARARVLSSGQSVLQTEHGVIYEVFPDGRKLEVKRITSSRAVAAGSVFTLRP